MQQAEIQGVPAFYASGPGKQVGAIVFRVGQADEPFMDRGTTHLIEHLALSGLDGAHYTYNGGTGLTETSFYARGSAEEVTSFLNHVVRTLADLPWARAEAEADVLKAEAAQRSPSVLSTGLRALLGENHAGQIGAIELALDRLDLNAIDSWRRSFFTRLNAAMWFSGPPPLTDALDLSYLPDGERRPVPQTRRLVPHTQHGLFDKYQSPAAISIVPRTFPLTIGTALIGRRLNDRLRGDLGVAYGASTEVNHLSGAESIVLLSTQAAQDHASVVYEESQEELAKFVYRGGPTQEELAWYYDMFVRASQDPDCAPSAAANAVSRELVGLPILTDQQIIDRIQKMHPQSIADSIAQLRDTFCWLLPGGADIADRRLASIGTPDVRLRTPVHEYLPNEEQLQRMDDPRRKIVLVLADEGMTVDYNSEHQMPGGNDLSTIRIADLMAAYISTDGVWYLWSKQWRTLTINPWNWSLPERVHSRLQELVPAQLIVRERADKSMARRKASVV